MRRELTSYKKDYEDDFKLKPFKDLSKKIKKRRKKELLSFFDNSKLRSSKGERKELDEQALFIKAMEDVLPLKGSKGRGINAVFSLSPSKAKHINTIEVDEKIGLKELCALVEGKIPIDVSNTPEYISGGEKRLAAALCQGIFAIQAYLDLHGLDRISALLECESFFKEAISTSKRCVAIIHGRGLSSKDKPILKSAVFDWLKRGPFRKKILAFSSAPYWDGGAGVTYVLLTSYHKNKNYRTKL